MELPAGTVNATRTERGDSLEIVQPSGAVQTIPG